MTKQRLPKHIKIDAEYAELVVVDFGTSNLRIDFGNTNKERFKEIGNYPIMYKSYRPSTITQALSNIIYRKFENRPAKVMGFGFCKPRVRYNNISVTAVKTPLLPDPQNYSHIYTSQIIAAKEYLLDSAEQISEDFIKKAVEYTIKENYRHESNYIAFANVSDIQHATRKNKVAVEVFDFGTSTTDITVSEIHFSHNRKSLEAIDELKESLGIAVGGNLFDKRFGRPLFENHFREISKPYWSIENCNKQTTKNYKEEYPYSIPNNIDKEDMNYIMKPLIAEIYRYIVDHLSDIKLDIVVLSDSISEIVHLRVSLEKILKSTEVLKSDRKIVYNPGHSTSANRNIVVKGLFFLSHNRDLFQNRYTYISLAYIVRYKYIELSDKQNIPDIDSQQEGFYNSANRIMTKGVCIPGGVQMIEIYYDIDTNRTTLDLSPIDIYILNASVPIYQYRIRKWNFTSQYTTVATLHLQRILTGINIEKLEESTEGKYRVWVQLGFEVGIEIVVEVFWRYDGHKYTTETSEFSYDTLDDHLESLRSISEGRKVEIEKHKIERKAEMKRADTERADMEKKIQYRYKTFVDRTFVFILRMIHLQIGPKQWTPSF
ncbi:hypothetical protein CJF31_00011290 [Rutstroemia sp. NJR-2017a BVV2]|nr:hypothetical protein CJF31_00011290 [Rutstroemia sp. NJR-2017a BVV2]